MKRALLLVPLILFLGARAEAGPGIRAGITDDPETLFVGAHWRVPLTNETRKSYPVLQPGVDFGLALNDPLNFLVRGTAHFAYLFPVADVVLYPLLGPTAVLYHFDVGGGSDTELEVGVDLGGGIQFDWFAVELWFGITDEIPDITIMGAFNF